MRRILLPFIAALAACAPSPQEAAMHRSSPVPPAAPAGIGATTDAVAPGDPGQAALGPIPAPVSATGVAAPAPKSAKPESPAAAQGRRTLSTAFVRVGADGYLTVERRDGRVLVLRDVVMRAADYCGMRAEERPGRRYCGDYAEVATARPGGGPGAAPVADPGGPGRRAPGRR